MPNESDPPEELTREQHAAFWAELHKRAGLDSPYPHPPSQPPKSQACDLQAEIESLRRAIAWLAAAFDRSEDLNERLKISANLGMNVAYLAKLVRTQDQIASAHGPGVVEPLADVLDEVLREMGRL